MEIHTLVSTFESVLHQHSGMGYFVDLLLKSLFVISLMIVINLFTRRMAASLRHLVWCIGFISLFFLPLFIGFLPKIQVPINTADTVMVESVVTQGIVSMADDINLALGAWWGAFLGVYVILLLLQVSYLLLGCCKVYCLSNAAEEVESPLIHQELENLVWEEGLTVSVGLKKSTEVFSPVSWGLFAPEVILPQQAENWSSEKIRSVLIHELGHIQRLDWLTVLIVRLTRAIYWFNPLVWYAARKLEEEAEQCCDDAVILYGHCQNEYASNLLEIASHARVGRLGNVIAQAIAGSFLGSRVFSILDPARKRQKTEFVWVVRGLLMSCTVIAILASLRLVPLVNVTSIDPLANTAFSVIFIPDSEASTGGSYVESLYESAQAQAQSADRENEPANEESPKTNAGVMAQSAGSEGNAGGGESASLLEDYMEATGVGDPAMGFDQYVREQASFIIRNVQSGIDLTGFAEGSDMHFAEEPPPPIPLQKIYPEYPKRARQRGIEGYSIVEYKIDRMGKVTEAIIVDSKPGSVFNRSSLNAIQQTLFKPPKINGEVVSLKGLQTKFVYQLKPG